VVRHSFNWKKLSICGLIGYRPDGRRTRLYFHLLAGSYRDTELISVLKQLKRHMRGQAVILLWDGLPSHRSANMRQYLGSQIGWLSVVSLPAYAPDVNPVEGLWNNIQAHELANRSSDDLTEVMVGVENGMERIGPNSRLLFSFLSHAGLSFQ
jgi:transposase